MYVCVCNRVTETEVQEVVSRGCTEPAELVSALRLDNAACCGRCRADLDRVRSFARDLLLVRR